MKICSIVGIRKSGKTTVVTELTKELKKRGYRVGTVKTVFCPNFSLDEEGSNTDRHKKAGADIIGVRGKREMSLIYPYGMDDNVFFRCLMWIFYWQKAITRPGSHGSSVRTAEKTPKNA